MADCTAIWQDNAKPPLVHDARRLDQAGDEFISSGNWMVILLPLTSTWAGIRREIYEINRSGIVVWSHMEAKVSHDADRLQNGNTLYVFGNNDTKSDYQAKEVNSSGQLFGNGPRAVITTGLSIKTYPEGDGLTLMRGSEANWGDIQAVCGKE